MYLLNYHFIFCTRYRKKVLTEEVRQRFIELVNDLCKENHWSIQHIDVQLEYCHLLIKAHPEHAPNDIMSKIKRITSRCLREEFGHLSHLQSLWTRAFLVSTNDFLTPETIQSFVHSQKKRG